MTMTANILSPSNLGTDEEVDDKWINRLIKERGLNNITSFAMWKAES